MPDKRTVRLTLVLEDAPDKRQEAHDGPFDGRLSRFLRRALKDAKRAFGLRCEVIKPDECPGHDRFGGRRPCCSRAGEYNGFGSDGPLLFECPARCSCHD
jgi:hypothetical protein